MAIEFAIDMAIKLSTQVGCRFLYLDAKRNSDPRLDVIHFYKNMGFEHYKEDNSKETPLYMDILPFIKELAN